MTLFADYIYPILSGLLQVAMQAVFFERCIGKQARAAFVIPFSILGCAIINMPLPALMKAVALAGILTIGGVFLLKSGWGASVLYGLLTVEVMQLCFGLVNAVMGVLSPLLYPRDPALFGIFFMVGGTLAALGLAYLCYEAILRFFGCQEPAQNQSVLMIWTPLFLVFLVSGYIGHTVYGNTVMLGSEGQLMGTDHILMLGVQALGIASIFCMMAAYQRLLSGFTLRMRYAALEQQSSFQRQYVEEAQARYENTRSLRHDMKNHILVLKGLLDKDETGKAKAYIADMDTSLEAAAFPFRTGNSTVDVLLQNKAALAQSKGISMESALVLPSSSAVNDMDFSIILSNALDNAIHAAEKLPEGRKKTIRVSSRRQGDFLLIEVLNGFDGGSRFQRGVGLNNIKWAAEKYGGTMEFGVAGDVFRLSVLLVISQQPENISQQSR